MSAAVVDVLPEKSGIKPQKEGGKFDLVTKGFESDYAEKAHLQKSFNSRAIAQLTESIVQWFPDTHKTPLSILDLCCGDGGSTHEFLKALDKAGINVRRVVGYDISREQIVRANEHSQRDSRLSFRVQDIEKMEDINNYDIVISLFGLHWMENLENAAEKIHKAMKPNGKLIFFVPLEKMDLFQLRLNMIASKKWQPYFQHYKLSPFIADEGIYMQAFDKHFLKTEFQRGCEKKEFSEKAFITFLSSWMQEMRHLSDKDKREEYVQDLTASISEDGQPNVKRYKKDGAYYVLFNEQFLFYKGSRKLSNTIGNEKGKQGEKVGKEILWGYKTPERITTALVETSHGRIKSRL